MDGAWKVFLSPTQEKTVGNGASCQEVMFFSSFQVKNSWVTVKKIC